MSGEITQAGRYQIVNELGRGAMGVVYRAFDPMIGRTVAIKTMLTQGLAPSEFAEFRDRFQREAQAAGILNHPNIVTVYDFGESQGFLYLAMEFLEGKSLHEILRERKALPAGEAVPIFEQVAGALGHAHAHKVIHRDVKPANIMLLKDGTVKVTDFGIAKISTTSMTQTGQVFGTPNYMSPEQVRGMQLDGRSDIFALGVVLYESLVGVKPFPGDDITTVLYKLVHEEPVPPLQLRPELDPGLGRVIQKALAKNPDQRYATCADFARDLRGYRQLPMEGAAGAATPGVGATMMVAGASILAGGASTAPPTTGARAASSSGPVAEASIQRGAAPGTASAPAPGARKRAVAVAAIICVLVALAAAGYYFFKVRRAPQGNSAVNALRTASAAEQRLAQQAEQSQAQGKLDDSLADWRAVAALNGPFHAQAEQQISRIEGIESQEQNLYRQGQAAQSAHQWTEALGFYQRVANLNGDMQPQALAAIDTVRRIQQGENVSALAARTFQAATAAFRNKQYEQARSLYQQVVALNVSGSPLLPRAHARIQQLDSVLASQQAAQQQARAQEQQAFQSGAALLKQGKFADATKAFQNVVAMNGPLKQEAQSEIQQIETLEAAQQNSLSQHEQQLFNTAAASEKSGQLSDARAGFEAVIALNGNLKADAQTQIQQIDQQMGQQREFHRLVAQFNQAKQQNDAQSLSNLLPLFGDIAAANGPLASQARAYAQTMIPAAIDGIRQASVPKAQPVAAPPASNVSVVLLQPAAPLRWTRKVQQGHLYSQAYIDGGLKLLRHDDLAAIARQAKAGSEAIVSLQINEKGQVTGGQVLEDTSGEGQSVLAAALQGWAFSSPTVRQIPVTTTATVRVRF